MAAIFLRFSKGSVLDLLLWHWISQGAQNMRDDHSLYEVEHRNAVSYRAQDRISIGREDDIPLSIDSPTKVRKLHSCVHFSEGRSSNRALP